MYSKIEGLLSILESTGKHYDIEKIKNAYQYAEELHRGQFRVSGEEYITHPIAVAEIVARLEIDTDSICAALLHDTVEDCSDKTDIEEIKKRFGDEVAELVDGLTKLVAIPFDDKEERHMENLRKMFLAMSKDIRVIFIKLCDRLHNMRTLGVKKDEKRRLTALETMYVYAPLAHRLGMQKIKQQLENLSLEYLDPIGYSEIKRDIDRRYGENRDFIENARSRIYDVLEKQGFEFTLEGRVKSVYSIYKKMYEQNKSFEEIYDFYALRIIVNTELECYTVLGLIHDMFNSMPGRFKDYISTPKPNMYRSLHTTVIGRDGIPFEVQIRTWEMHHIAEYGVAAHWKYKSGEQSKEEIDRKLQWVSKLIDTEDETRDADEFLQALKIDIFHDETFVFTPKGDVITLPYNATVIDFAYAIHSEVGNKMVGAKINGMIVPIDRVPKTGEIVDIITSAASKGPSRDWLNIVHTGEARTKIRQWFKREKRSENIIVGKNEIDKELKKYGRNCTEAQRNEVLLKVAQRVGIQTIDDFYNIIGYGGLSVSKIAAKLRDEFDRTVKPDEELPMTEEQIQAEVVKSGKSKSSGGVIIDGVDGCSVKFSKCCNPLPGDSIIGFITKGYGISVHKIDCPNVIAGQSNREYDGRWVSAKWEKGSNLVGVGGNFEAILQIYAKNGQMLLADITGALADMHIMLLQINTQKTRVPDDIIINITVGCKNLEHVSSIVSRIRAVEGVESVKRGFV